MLPPLPPVEPIPDAGISRAEFIRRRELAIAHYSKRAEEQALNRGIRLGGSTRGCVGCAVICLTENGPDGKPLLFKNSTRAGIWANGLRGNHIRRSIIRGGTAGGHRWAWADPSRVVTPEERAREKKNARRQGEW